VKPFWNGFFLSLSLSLDLGIVNLAILEVSLQRGGTAGFLLGVGSCLGDLIYFAAVLLGASVLLEAAVVRWALWIFGTGALLFLAWRMAGDVIRPKTMSSSGISVLSNRDGAKLLFTGIGMALASPTAILWFAAVGGSVIVSSASGQNSLLRLGAGFATAGLIWVALFAYSAATLRAFGPRIVRALSLVSALLFFYFAGLVFLNGVKTLF
jgi:L-lysine exporter family protein LysE/ArgO